MYSSLANKRKSGTHQTFINCIKPPSNNTTVINTDYIFYTKIIGYGVLDRRRETDGRTEGTVWEQRAGLCIVQLYYNITILHKNSKWICVLKISTPNYKSLRHTHPLPQTYSVDFYFLFLQEYFV
jgi:hypothetical protein